MYLNDVFCFVSPNTLTLFTTAWQIILPDRQQKYYSLGAYGGPLKKYTKLYINFYGYACVQASVHRPLIVNVIHQITLSRGLLFYYPSHAHTYTHARALFFFFFFFFFRYYCKYLFILHSNSFGASELRFFLLKFLLNLSSLISGHSYL